MIYTIDYTLPACARLVVEADSDAEALEKVQEIIENSDGDPFEIDWGTEAEYDIVEVEIP